MDLGDFMGVTSLHFSTLIITMLTFFDAVLLAGSEEFLVLAPPPENEDVAEFVDLEVGAHVAVPFVLHAVQLLELVADQVVAVLLATGLGLLVGDGGHAEEEGLLGDVVELVVDSPAQEDGLVAGEGDEHEVVGRVRVVVEQVRGQQLL